MKYQAKRVQAVSCVVNDRPGILLDITKELREKRVNLTYNSCIPNGSSGRGVMLFIGDDTDTLKEVLGRNGTEIRETTCCYVEGEEDSVGLNDVCSQIQEAGENIRSCSVVSTGNHWGAIIVADEGREEELCTCLGC